MTSIHIHRVILRIAAVQVIILFIPFVLFPQNKLIIRPTEARPEIKGMSIEHPLMTGRPKVGLVLSGGGARGIAQIGVIRVLEQQHIPIDVIVGNSLGSVIGGLYASGYSTTQLENIVSQTNWTDLLSFSEETKRTELFVGQREYQQEGFLELRFDGLQPIIPSAISGGQRLSNYFSYLTLQALYHPNPSFDDLKIPFRAVATDLLSGKRIILDHGSLSEAMRASIAVPLLYAPLETDSTSLVDGGLVSNIPVDVAKSLGCDIVIVVNSTSPMRNAGQLNAPWEIADQIMTIMMQVPNKTQLNMADVVITPKAGDRVASDFTGIDSLIRAGEEAAEHDIQRVADVVYRRMKDTSGVSSMSFHQPIIRFTGDSLPQAYKQEILEDAKSDSLSIDLVRSQLNRINRSGSYREVDAEITEQHSPAEIEYHAELNPLIAEIHFSGNRLLPDDVIAKEMNPLKGKVLDYNEVQKSLENVLQRYRDKGYSLARIESAHVDPDQSLNFTINEGRIKEIHYQGNKRTKDYIIRREFPMDEGDVFDVNKAALGMVNIKSTGLFTYVLLDIGYRNNQPVVILKVNEKSSELLRLGLHADNERNLVTTVDIRDDNFRGAWENLALVMKYGYRDRAVRTEYTVNRIFNTYLTANTKFYFNSRDVLTYKDDPSLGADHWDRLENGKFRENKYGWSLSFGSHFERLGDVSAELRVENHNIIALSGQGYTPERYRFVGLNVRTVVDTKNKFSFPTEGLYLELSYESAMKGLGSQVGFGKIGVDYESYWTFLPRHTIHPKVIFGFADATLPIAEQYSLGGFDSFYGLREDDSRGRQLFLVNLEYRFWFPFKLVFETYIKARYDLGTISDLPQELKFNNFRHAVGGAVSLDTPLGEASFGMGKSFYFRQELPTSPVSVGPLLFYFSFGYHL